MGNFKSKREILINENEAKYWDKEQVKLWLETEGFGKKKSMILFLIIIFLI